MTKVTPGTPTRSSSRIASLVSARAEEEKTPEKIMAPIKTIVKKRPARPASKSITPSPKKTTPIEKVKLTPKQTRIQNERIEWCRKTRLMFTPRDMIDKRGNINQDYFKPSMESLRNALISKGKALKWGEEDKKNLIKGIEKHGVGSWESIRTEFLPAWSNNNLRIKCMRLLGRQDLSMYSDKQYRWKGSAEDIKKEFDFNKALALKLDCWKGSTLVRDEKGLVQKELEKHHAKLRKASKG